MKDIIKHSPIIAILRNVPDELLIPYTAAVKNGGITAFEVAMNTPSGADQIKKLRNYFGDEIIVGAGTVVTRERIMLAEESGAQFYLTPSADEPLLQFCRSRNLRLLPGVLTPSDVALCARYGYHLLKLFPAGAMPSSYIQSLKGPFDDTDYVAVGGVSAENIRQLFQSGFVGAGIGSSLIPKALVQAGDWHGASIYIREHYSPYCSVPVI